MAGERDMVAGMLAVRLGLATPAQVQAVHALPPDASSDDGLAATMESMGLISPPQRSMVERMADDALGSHAGDLEATVDSVGGLGGFRQAFGLAATLDSATEPPHPIDGVSTAPLPDVDSTVTVTPEQPGRYTSPAGEGDDKELGRGGIGRVLVVRDSHLGRDVALKELLARRGPGSARRSGTAPDLTMSRFLREARITGQLEHPNIVPVYELGQRRDGTLYYTMKVVRGRTLADALTECRGLADRMRLVKHYSDLCHAMAYAHDRGVVHRDLKPGNVMVGAFGETVLLDWGLAKPVEQAEPTEQSVHVSPRMTGEAEEVDLAATAEGSMLGTPLYMSPEQARGEVEAIGPQTDVWSLGVMLYELLTGVRPFGGRGALQVVRAVIGGSYTPVRERCPEAPPELAAVVDRALSLDLGVRYPDAKALADEIDAWLTGGRVGAYKYGLGEVMRRFARQHRVALAVAGVAAVLLVATAVVGYLNVVSQRDRALVAEHEARTAAHAASTAAAAERQAAAEARVAEQDARLARDRAEGLVQYMVGELREQLEPLGRLDLIDGVIARVSDKYRAEAEQLDARANPARARSRAATLMVIARLALARGRGPAAADAAVEARALFDTLSRVNPSREAVHDLARANLEVYRAFERLGRRTEAQEHANVALQLLTPLTEVPDADPVHILSRAEAYVALGDLAATGGKLAWAERNFHDALTQRQRLTERDPKNMRWAYAVSLGHDRVGNALLDQGRIAEARAEYQRALDIRAALVAARPGNLLWVHKLGVSHDQLGDVALEEGAPEEAEAAFDRAAVQIKMAAEANPTHRGWRRDLAVVRLKQGDAQAARGTPIKALATYTEAEALLTELVDESKTTLDWVRDLNVARWRRVDQLIALNRLGRAKTIIEASLADATRIATVAKGNMRYRHDVAIAYFKQGDLAGRQGDAVAASVAYRQAAKLLAPMARSDATNNTLARDLDAARRRLAATLNRGGLDRGALWAAIKASDQARAQLGPLPVPEGSSPSLRPIRTKGDREDGVAEAARPVTDAPEPPPAGGSIVAARPRPSRGASSGGADRVAMPRPAPAPPKAKAPADEASAQALPMGDAAGREAERAKHAGGGGRPDEPLDAPLDEPAVAAAAELDGAAGLETERGVAELKPAAEAAFGAAAGGESAGVDLSALLEDPDLAVSGDGDAHADLTPLYITSDRDAPAPRSGRRVNSKRGVHPGGAAATPRPRPARRRPAQPRIRPTSSDVPERPGRP